MKKRSSEHYKVNEQKMKLLYYFHDKQLTI